jgi:hypothetical protein
VETPAYTPPFETGWSCILGRVFLFSVTIEPRVNKGGGVMTLDQIANIAEVSAAALVIVSLIYVAMQIKQNTKATQISTSQAFIDTHGKVVLHVSGDKEFRDIYWRGLKGLSNLDGSETAAFATWTIHTFRVWESFYYQWQDGVFDDRLWAGWKNQLCDLFGYRGIREIWSARNHQLSEKFREFVDHEVVSAESKPLYVSQEAQT